MRKMLKYLNTCKKRAILTPLLVLVEAATEILIPVYMGRLIDQGIYAGNIDVVTKNGIIMVLLAVVALIFGVLASRNAAIVANELGRNLRDAQFSKIQGYDFHTIDQFSTSSLITRQTMDVSMIQNALQLNIRIAFRAPAMIIFSIIAAALVGGKLALVFVAVTPFIGFGLWFIMKHAHPHFVQMFVKIDKLNLTVQENLTGIRTVKSYVREDMAINDFNQATEDVSENAKKAEKWIVFNNPIMQFSICLSFVLIGWFGSNMIVSSTLTQGQFANVITYVMQILMSLMLLSQVFLMIVISKASVKRITEVLDAKSTLNEKDNPVIEVKDGSFEFRNVNFSYETTDAKEVLTNISFKVNEGSFVGIFGATGTGKSSLIQLISRLYDTTSGQVLVGGVDVRDYKLDSLRESVITVLQKNILFSGTVKENIKWGKEDATDEEVIAALKKACAYEFVSKMPKGLDTWIEQGGVNVSGGQRQRLCIARALIANPKILIMDDSTSAVDTKTDMLIKQSLKNETPQMTKVVIAQRVASIEAADQIIILDNKGINQIGNHQTLYGTNEIYTSVYDAQQKGKEVSTDAN